MAFTGYGSERLALYGILSYTYPRELSDFIYIFHYPIELLHSFLMSRLSVFGAFRHSRQANVLHADFATILRNINLWPAF